ncbi:ABC transporter substrate-binding protein [Pseudochelatococcus sp. B33]
MAGGSRRQTLQWIGGACLALARPVRSFARSSLIASPGWVATQSLLALGVEPALVCERVRYTDLVIEPALPPDAVEAGLRSEPNLELIAGARPEYIVIDATQLSLRQRLEKIAPVLVHRPVGAEGFAFDEAEAALIALSVLFGRQDVARGYAATVRAEIAACRERLSGSDKPPIYLVSPIDTRRLMVFGRTSVFGVTTEALGYQNAWEQPVGSFGFSVTGIEQLAARDDAVVALIGLRAEAARAQLASHPLWARLDFVRANRIITIPQTLSFGGLPIARRFARFAAERFSQLAESHV